MTHGPRTRPMRETVALLTSLLATILMLSALVAPPGSAGGASPRAAGDFNGTADVDGCSGSVVRMPTSTDDDPALLLTSGHCFEGPLPVPDEVLVDQPSHRLVTLLDSSGAAAVKVHVARAAYVTMTGTDLALYRLEQTYRQLADEHGVRALAVSARRPKPGARIRVVSGSLGQVFDCRLESLVYRVLETGYVSKDAIRYASECNTRSGTSGSPVLSAGGKVVGVNSTSNTEGGQCLLDNPCEMDRNGTITVRKGASYGTQTYWLTTCMAPGNVLDLEQPGCRLPRPDPRQPTE